MSPFRPFPLLGNPHVQTVLGSLVGRAALTFPAQATPIALPDGDAVVIHDTTPAGWQPGQPIALLVHGLGGCHQSPYMVRIAQLLALRGVRACRMDLRGCGAGMTLARRFYCADCTDDVRTVLAHLHAEQPTSPLLLAGFSLGGGIVLKTAGQLALPGVCAVAAVAPPLDLLRCSALIARQPFYNYWFVRHLVRQVYEQQRLQPQLPPMRFPRRLTLWDFDEMYTAPRWGFAGTEDYYRRASSLPWVPRVRLPLFLLTARDDPFIAVESFEALAPAANLEVHITPHGGHLGFLGPDGQGGARWAERQVVDWLLARAAAVVAGTTAGDNETTLPATSSQPEPR